MDKSGRFAVMPMEVYLRARDEHVVDDKELTEKELKGVQRKLNEGSRRDGGTDQVWRSKFNSNEG